MSAANHVHHNDEQCTVCHGRGTIYVEDAQPLTRCPGCGTQNRSRPGHQTRCGKCRHALAFTPASFTPTTGEAPCPYCQGAKTSMWAHHNALSQEARQAKRARDKRDRAIAYLVIYGMTLVFIPGTMGGFRIFLVIPAIYWVRTIWKGRRMTPRRLARARFTSPEEANLVRNASYGLTAGLWLKDSLNRRHRKQGQQQAQWNAQAYQQQQNNRYP